MTLPNGNGRPSAPSSALPPRGFLRLTRLIIAASAIAAASAGGLMVACGSDDAPATPTEGDGGPGLDGNAGRDTSEPPDQPEPDGGVFSTPNADAGCPLKYAGPRNGIVAASVPRPNTTGGIPWEGPEKGLTVDTMYARAVLDDDQQSELLRVTNYGFIIPPTASIKGIVVQLKRRGENKVVDGNIQLWLDGVPSDRPKFVASGWPTAIGTHHYGQEVDTWGNALTPELVGKTGFGTEIWAKRRTDAGTGPIPGEVESLIMTVWYCD